MDATQQPVKGAKKLIRVYIPYSWGHYLNHPLGQYFSFTLVINGHQLWRTLELVLDTNRYEPKFKEAITKVLKEVTPGLDIQGYLTPEFEEVDIYELEYYDDIDLEDARAMVMSYAKGIAEGGKGDDDFFDYVPERIETCGRILTILGFPEDEQYLIDFLRNNGYFQMPS